VILVLDASMAVAWLLKRRDPDEVALAARALDTVRNAGALIPALWHSEVANAILLGERQRIIVTADSASFLATLSLLEIIQDDASPATLTVQILQVGRAHNLTAYDAAYLELALRTGRTVATFDRKLAEAARIAGVKVFGDPV
jgi:predicted nucleic acid-binding protein